MLAAGLAIAISGCTTGHQGAATRPSADGRRLTHQRIKLTGNAALTLEQIAPLRPLPAPAPSTAPSTAASTQPADLDALVLFAQARKALDAGQRFSAVQLLQQALKLDPDSYEMHMMLGSAARGTSVANVALPAFQRALEINPDSADAYVEIARIHARAGETQEAIRAMRDAQQTTAYKTDNDVAIAIDYQLAQVLDAAGYDSAALDQYEVFLHRLPRMTSTYRGPIEVMQVLRNPDTAFKQIAELAARVGDYKTALSAIEEAIVENPDAQEYSMMRIRYLQQANRSSDARSFIPKVISRFGAGPALMKLLGEAWQDSGGQPAAIASLRQACAEDPSDTNLGVALADLLASSGKPDEARDVLQRLVSESDYRQDAVLSLYNFYESQGQIIEAARLLIYASARRPANLSEISQMMSRLTRLSRSNHLRLRQIQEMQVQSFAEPARQYWLARLAELWNRDELARSALEKAVRSGKPYRPAFRQLVNHFWSRRDWDDQRKTQSSLELVMLASLQGDESLADELRGMIAIRQNKPSEAAAALLDAMRHGSTEPDVQLAYAIVQDMQGNNLEAERTLLKINEEFPLFEQAYVALINFHIRRGTPAAGLRTLQRWLAADPRNPTARLFHATILRITGRMDDAEKILLDVFDEYADNPQVLEELREFYAQSRRLDRYIALLEQKRAGRPDIREIATELFTIYAIQGRQTEALKVLEDLRHSAAGDSDLLYSVSNLYMQINDRATAKAILNEVLTLDPKHSSAANDLGYFLAEDNAELDRALELVHIAVEAEPDNQAFLDSLGWVLYKRGDFEQAHTYLERAIAQTLSPDPVVLDHLGDACYRVGKTAQALKYWEEANTSLSQGPPRPDLKTLASDLQKKMRQFRSSQRVLVAPTAEEFRNSKK